MLFLMVIIFVCSAHDFCSAQTFGKCICTRQKRSTTDPKKMPRTTAKNVSPKINASYSSCCCGPMLTLLGIHCSCAAQGVQILPHWFQIFTIYVTLLKGCRCLPESLVAMYPQRRHMAPFKCRCYHQQLKHLT